jgi:hypothetical protein
MRDQARLLRQAGRHLVISVRIAILSPSCVGYLCSLLPPVLLGLVALLIFGPLWLYQRVDVSLVL